ncbi:hypothetical protein BASA61_007189 [Batrachochytrium salamandrivorans]|nr:hypothetical protein BASA61_007189 [Batrachochytrium salamandrivorans]
MNNTGRTDTQPCIFNSVFYKAGTQIPFIFRFGSGCVLYNHSTGMIVPLAANGSVRLDGGNIYTAEDTNSKILRFTRLPEPNIQMRRNSDMPPGFFKSLTLGRSSNRRRSDSSVANPNLNHTRKNTNSKGSTNALKASVESKEEGSEECIEKNALNLSKLNNSVNSTSTTPLAEALLESTLTSGFFTLRRKGRKPASDLEHESGEHSSPKDLAKSMLTIQTNSGHLDDELDLVSFLNGPQKELVRKRSKSVCMDRPEGLIVRSPQADSSLDATVTMSLMSVMTVESVIGNRQSTLSSRSQTSTTHPDTTHQNTRPKSGLSVNLVSDSDVRQYCTLGVSTDGLHRDNSSIDIASASSSTTHKRPVSAIQAKDADLLTHEGFLRSDANVDTSLSSKPAVEIRLENCVAMPVRSTTENVFEITYPDGKLRCYPQTYASMIMWVSTINTSSSNISPWHGVSKSPLEDFHMDIYSKEYHSLLSALRDETGMTDEAAAALGVEVVSENLPHSPIRQKSMDDFGKPIVQYRPDTDGVQTPFHIVQATIEKLIERAIDSHGPDKQFISMILHTYRHIIPASSFLELIKARLHVLDPPKDASNEDSFSIYWKPVLKIRAISMVYFWIKSIWSPDFVYPDVRESLERFVVAIQGSFGPLPSDKELDDLHCSEFRLLSGHLRGVIRRRDALYTAPAPAMAEGATSPVVIKQGFLDFDSVDLARQLTLLEQDQLCIIKPIHYLLRIWADEKDPIIERELRPLNDAVSSFNTVSFWVATEICTQPEIKNRAKVVEGFIKLAKECRKLNNFNTLMAVISGLNLVAVSRLKATWEITDPKRVKQLNELEALLSPTNNFRIYRSLVAEIEEEQLKNRRPYIPILSLFLKDFLFMNDGNPKIVDNGCINVDKLRTMYSRASEALLVQNNRYSTCFTGQPTPLQLYCNNLRALKEQALYKYSCLCEPKNNPGDDIRLREKWMSK